MSKNSSVKQPVCLIVIDGWGISENKEGNAIHHAKTPVMDRLFATNAIGIEAHGLHVGLPEGLMGNSEVGHLNIGAGRVVYQDIVRINLAVEKNQLVTNAAFSGACERAKAASGNRLHLIGLSVNDFVQISDGGVHSHITHLFGMIKAAKANNVDKCFVHFLSDGRDTSPNSGVTFMHQLMDFLKTESYGVFASVIGRYYAMDRDKRWERVKIAYEALVAGIGEKSDDKNIIKVVQGRYNSAPPETDEFLKPIILSEEGRVKANDTLVFFDYRADRMRQINETFGLQRHFKTDVKHPDNLALYTMTQYKQEFPFPQLFPAVHHKNVLAEWLSSCDVSQFHSAETEKYAHVTFFFNGGVETQFKGEERCLVPSPKVPTYDHQPEMSSVGVGDKMVDIVKSKTHPFIMCNFAPPDMVGHTGIYEAAVKACEATDIAIGRIEEACKANGYVLMITSDHGNAEKMVAEDGGMHTAHTCFKVPFISTGDQRFTNLPKDRLPALCDVAPTVLAQMGLPLPADMTGQSLIS